MVAGYTYTYRENMVLENAPQISFNTLKSKAETRVGFGMYKGLLQGHGTISEPPGQ